MASLIREWTGIQQFPSATQTKMFELLGKLKQENVNSLTILVMGKGGVGKSSTVNSIIGERVVAVSAFQSEGPRPVMVSRSRAGFTLNVIDTPGLVEGGYVNDQALEIIKRFLLNKTIDVLLYVDRLDAYRVDNLDRQVVRAITESFGKEIWNRGLVVLTHAQLSPPDALSYEDFFSRRSEALLKVVRMGARIKKQDMQGSSIPVVLVENSGRCNKNDCDEKIVPNGTAWIPNLVKTIAEIVSNGSKGILVDKKLIEGPNPNERGKLWIPLILAFQTQHKDNTKNQQSSIQLLSAFSMGDQSMDPNTMWRLQTDWYSPTRLLSGSPVQDDFPGDRFIPNRSLMDLDQAHTLLTSWTKETSNSKFNHEYRQKVEENLNLDSEGRPFKMLVFRGSPKSSRKSLRLVDEMRRSEEEAFNHTNNANQYRNFPKKEARILDAPRLKDDYYLNIMDWGKNNILAIALGSEVYMWNAENSNTQKLFQVDRGNDYPSSVAWSDDAKTVAVGHMCSEIHLWDAEALKPVRILEGHQKKVGTLAWNGHILTSGSQDRSIINHDVRVRNSMICRVQTHTHQVCGLKWSNRGNLLASGGNDNMIYIWEASKMSSSHFLHRLDEHNGAVKALAWCPYDSHVLASGGGTMDGCIKLWSIQKGLCINSIDTHAQVCGLEWNRHHKEILSGHGYSASECKNQLCLWKYPSMSTVGGSTCHSSRVLHLSQSPDGLNVISAVADETLRLWEIFGPPQPDKKVSQLDGLLSLKTSPIR